MLEVCEFFEKERRVEANTAAYVHAIGWTCLFNGFGGEGSKKSSPWDLLPYPDEIHKAERESKPRRVTEETEAVLRRLLKDERVPERMKAIFTALVD